MKTSTPLSAFLLAAATFFIDLAPAGAATRTWTGLGGGPTAPLWSNITNWSGLLAPGNGDDLFFPVTAGNKSSVHNLAATNYDTIFFAGSNYVFVGATIGLSGGIVATNRDGTNTFTTPLLLRASQTFSNGGSLGRAVLAVAGGLNLNGRDLTWAGSGTNRAVSAIFGAGDMTKGGSGELLLGASNSFSGLVLVTNGNLRLGHPSSLGGTNFSVIVSNADVVLNTNVSITNKSLELGLFTAFIAEGGTNTWAGPVTITDFAADFRARTNTVLRIHGAVADLSGQGVGIGGPGTIIFSGSATNTSSDPSNAEDFVSSGATWILDKPPGVPATQSRLRVIQGSTVRLNADEQLGGTRTVALTDGSALDLNGKNESIAFPADYPGAEPGRVVLGSSGTNELRLGGSGFTNFSGTVSGAGHIRQTGSGTWLFQGTNSATGTFTVAGGALIVDGRFDVAQLIVTNGTFGGTGRVAAVTLNGANGVLNPGLGTNTTGRLQIAGLGSWLAGKVQLELNGATPATQHDQIRVDTAPAITNCALEIRLGFAPALGATFTIITNTTANFINGQFTGLPEGAVINVGGTLLRISYLGGTGNDVTLRVVNSMTSTVTQVWQGTGANSFWLTSANWLLNTRPSGGESMFFSSGAARFVNTNDYPPNTIFNSILLGTNGYDLRGNGITLFGGVTSTNASGVNIIRLPLALGTNQTFAMTRGGGTLNLLAVNAGPHTLTINATGSVIFSGALFGTGPLLKTGPNQLVILSSNTLATNFINEGLFFVDGAVSGTTLLANGTTLNGSGFLSRVIASGATIEPGEAGGVNRLTIDDDLRATNGIVRFKIEGPSPGLSHDQILMTNVSGTIMLANPTLELALSYSPTNGESFTLIDKAGAAAITGTFGGLPEGATFNATNTSGSNFLFRLSYTGGTGNDVVLTTLYTGATGLERVWTGAAFPNTNWSAPANWSGNVAPTSGDALVFPGTALGKTNFNDLGLNLIAQSLRFSTGACNYRISGATNLLLAGGLRSTNATINPTVLVPLRLLADQTFDNTVAGVGLVLANIATDGHELTVSCPGGVQFSLGGPVSGSGSLRKLGGGSLNVSGANTYTGATIVEGGSFGVANNSAFGSTASGTTVSNGATVSFSVVNRTVNEPLALAGTLAGGNSNSTWTGPIVLTLPAATLSTDTNVVTGSVGTLRVTGPISGTGGFVKAGLGTVILAASNSYAGQSVVATGRLMISNSFALGLAGNVTVVSNGARLEFATNTSFTLPVDLDLSGTLAAPAGATTNVWAGDVQLSSASATIEVGADALLELPNEVVGGGGLVKTGAGLLLLQNDNTYQGLTRIAAGTLAINGNQIDSSVVVSNGATLAGGGQCGSVTALGGAISPGLFGNEGILRVAGGVTLDAASTFVADLIGAATHDQLRVNGAVDLGGAALALNVAYNPVAGDAFEIIRNDGIDPILGTLAGVPQNSIINNGGFAFRVNYAGGDGNDLVLTALFPAPTGITREWTGGGLPNTNWSNAANWLNNEVPLDGDEAFFPGAIENVRKTNFFDLPGRILSRLTFAGDQCRYRIFGTNNLRLIGGIVVTNTTFGPSFSVPLELLLDQTFSNAGPSGLRVTSVILNSNQLTFDGAGSFVIEGAVSGAGALVKRGAGPLRFNAATTFTGPLNVQAGSVEVNSTTSLGSTAAGTTLAEGASLLLVSSGHNFGEPLTLAGTLSGGATTNVKWSGPITLVAPDGTVNVDTNGALNISGVLGGSGALNKTGRGTLTLSGTNANTGGTFVQAGLLFVSGLQTGSVVTVPGGGVLGGTGMVAGVTGAGGSITPNGVGSAGVLRVAGDLTLDSSSAFRADLGGLIAGVEFDQLRAAGLVQLGGAQLVVGLTFLPSAGATFEILRKESAGPISGTFAGLAQDVTFNTGIFTWQISYTGGDGNDVVLTLLNTSGTPAERVWTGAGTPSTNWSNPFNWSGNIAPFAGDALVFPGGAQGAFIFNDLPGDLFFDSLRFATGTFIYVIQGATNLSLLGGITVTNTSSSPFVAPTVRLLADQTFTVDGGLVLGSIITDGHQAAFEGTGTVSIATFGINSQLFHPVISGTGGILKRGAGTLALGGTNTYTGETLVESGALELQRSQALGSPAAGTTVAPGATVQMGFGALNVPEPLALGGTLAMLDFALSGVWSGPVSLTAPAATLHVGSNNASMRISGVISGAGGFVKTGIGQLNLDADNSYSGATLVQQGALIISNSHLAGPITVNGTNSALALGGAAGAITSQGALLHAGPPFFSGLNVFFNTAGTPGAVDAASLTLDANTRFVADIAGLTAGSGFDQWRVAGNVALGGARLIFNLAAVTPVGSTFTLIRNDGAGAVSGTFAGLPEGTEFVRGIYRWRISYAGGDGNDVVLSVVDQIFSGLVWDGGSANTNWTTALNWVGDAAPLPGADLIFPTEAAGKTNVNDFAPGTGFNSLRFTSAGNNTLGHRLSGNPIVLTNGLTAETNSGSITLGLDLTLGGPAPWSAESGTTLTFTGALNNAGFDLNLAGPGTMTFNTTITGGGGLRSSAGLVSLRSNNTFTGSSLITTGAVRVDANGAFGAAAQTVTVENGAVLQLQNGSNVANALVLRGQLLAFRTNTWSGPITAEGASARLGPPGNGLLAIDGAISGSGELALAGGFNMARPLALNATNTYTGVMRLNSGLLLMNGAGAGGELHLATNQTSIPTVLTGTGTVSSVFAGGTISPGLTTNAGLLNVAGSLTLSNSAVLDIQVNGLGAGTGHDQLRVAGDVRLENAALLLLQPPSFLPNLGDTFVIIRNDGPNPVTGNFAGLPQGGTVTNCAVFQITYTGGDGNDVALVVTAQKGMVSQWTGNGGDTNWTTAANWLCGLPPDPGDTLIFSNGIPNRATHNDFPEGTTFSRLVFVGFTFGQPFFLGGNPITLTHGIDGYFSGANEISLPITMSAPQTFSNAFGQLTLRGGVTNNGHNLALDGGGIFDFLGPFSGAGGLSWSNTTFSFGSLYLRTNNSYSGPTVLSGYVYVPVYTPGGLGDTAAGTYIGPNTSVDLQIPMTLAEPITLAGQLDFASGSNVMAAPLTIEGSNASLCVGGPRMEFNGPISGSGLVQLCGANLNFYNTGGDFAGVMDIFVGQHIFIGEYPGTEVQIRGNSSYSATLAGTGRVRSIVAFDSETNSVIAPGVDGPGVLTVDGRFIIESNITVRMELNGATPGTGHDQLVVGGPVALTNCALDLSFGFTPAANDTFTLVQNTGATPVTGAFDGLPEGALITNAATVLQITYTGGDGNDIVLRPPAAPASTITSVVCLPDGTKQFEMLGQPNATYIIEAATNLLSPPTLIPWVPIGTNTADGLGFFQFIDLDSTNFLQRFYRVVSP